MDRKIRSFFEADSFDAAAQNFRKKCTMVARSLDIADAIAICLLGEEIPEAILEDPDGERVDEAQTEMLRKLLGEEALEACLAKVRVLFSMAREFKAKTFCALIQQMYKNDEMTVIRCDHFFKSNSPSLDQTCLLVNYMIQLQARDKTLPDYTPRTIKFAVFRQNMSQVLRRNNIDQPLSVSACCYYFSHFTPPQDLIDQLCRVHHDVTQKQLQISAIQLLSAIAPADILESIQSMNADPMEPVSTNQISTKHSIDLISLKRIEMKEVVAEPEPPRNSVYKKSDIIKQLTEKIEKMEEMQCFKFEHNILFPILLGINSETTERDYFISEDKEFLRELNTFLGLFELTVPIRSYSQVSRHLYLLTLKIQHYKYSLLEINKYLEAPWVQSNPCIFSFYRYIEWKKEQ